MLFVFVLCTILLSVQTFDIFKNINAVKLSMKRYVESALVQHAGVSEAAVVDYPDPIKT